MNVLLTGASGIGGQLSPALCAAGLQPIHIDDLTEAAVRILGDAKTYRTRIELVGPQLLTLRELLAALRAAMHLGPPRFVSIPMPLVRVGARVPGYSDASLAPLHP